MRFSQWMAAMVGVIITCVGLAASSLLAQETTQPKKVEIPATATTLEGIPTVRIDSGEGDIARRVLDAEEAAQNTLTISIVDGQFYWTSRGNRPLRLSSSHDFTYLSSEPGHYIRFTQLNDKISYVEHTDLAGPYGNVTWWGELKIVLGK